MNAQDAWRNSQDETSLRFITERCILSSLQKSALRTTAIFLGANDIQIQTSRAQLSTRDISISPNSHYNSRRRETFKRECFSNMGLRMKRETKLMKICKNRPFSLTLSPTRSKRNELSFISARISSFLAWMKGLFKTRWKRLMFSLTITAESLRLRLLSRSFLLQKGRFRIYLTQETIDQSHSQLRST